MSSARIEWADKGWYKQYYRGAYQVDFTATMKSDRGVWCWKLRHRNVVIAEGRHKTQRGCRGVITKELRRVLAQSGKA